MTGFFVSFDQGTENKYIYLKISFTLETFNWEVFDILLQLCLSMLLPLSWAESDAKHQTFSTSKKIIKQIIIIKKLRFG